MSSQQRLHYLDSVRGIAAMSVLIYHFIGWRWEKNISFHLASFIFNGSDAVSFFFVLSGFVLSYKYLQLNHNLQLKEFIATRFFRIYPAFIVTVLLNYLYVNRATFGLNTISDIFFYNSQELWQELVLVKNIHKFYIPGWTLQVEIALSLLMPFFVIIAKKDIRYLYALIPISIFINSGNFSGYTLHFCLGILLAKFYTEIAEYNFKESKFYTFRYLLLGVVFLLYSIRHIDRIQTLGDGNRFLSFWNIDYFHLTGFASFVILMIIINKKKLQNILHLKPLLFMGKISYSIYLMHWLVVVFIMERWERWQQYIPNEYVLFYTMLLIAIIATLLLSTILYYTVEIPFLKIGKRLVKKNLILNK